MTVVCGVDGCRGGWVVVYHDMEGGRFRWEMVPNLRVIAVSSPRPKVIAIDVPIGLPDEGARECDLEARRRLGHPRSSSVFPVLIRPLLAAASWEEANELRHALEGKGLPRQAWGLAPKIREVDDVLRDDDELRKLVHEVHPELCFTFMNGGEPMSHPKRELEGRRQRLEALRERFGDTVDEALSTKPGGCRIDDLVDAFATVWTAGRIARGEATTVSCQRERDSFGLPMEMVV